MSSKGKVPAVTKHAVERFAERVRRASPRLVAELAADARGPTDAEWRAIVSERRSRRTQREDVRVLGSIVFVFRGPAVVTVWRSENLTGGA